MRGAAVSAAGWVRRWWGGEAGPGTAIADVLLAPAEAGFRAAAAVRNGLYDRGWLDAASAPVPVIAIGNLTVGGTGKTPIAAWAAELLRDRGRTPAVVARGYAEDEIRLYDDLAPDIDLVHGADRLRAVEEAARRGADCVVLDDAFQHRALGRELDIVLVAVEQWVGNRRMLPRGPWREPPSALTRADYVIVTRKSAPLAAAEAAAHEIRQITGAEAGVIHLEPERLRPLDGGAEVPLEILAGEKVLAVTTLAEPEPFVRQLGAAGASVRSLVYPDHHPIGERELREISERANGDMLVVTRKEAVKLRYRLPAGVAALVLEQGVRVERGQAELERLLVDAARRGKNG